jgi:peptide deformylase
MKIPKEVVETQYLRMTALTVMPALIPHYAKGLETALKRADNAAGLALPQLGIPLRGFIISAKYAHPARKRFVFNPIIHRAYSPWVEDEEGCLSLPGKKFKVRRHVTIDVSYLNEHGARIEETLTGFPARVFQHEYDHLDGILIDHPTRNLTVEPVS